MTSSRHNRPAPMPTFTSADQDKKWVGELDIDEYDPLLNYTARENDPDSSVISIRVPSSLLTAMQQCVGRDKNFHNNSEFGRDSIIHNVWRQSHRALSPEAKKEALQLQQNEQAKQMRRKRDDDSARVRDVRVELEKFVQLEAYEAMEKYLEIEESYSQHLYQPYRDRMVKVLIQGRRMLANLKEDLNVTT